MESDKIEDILLRVVEFLRNDLSEEFLSPRVEGKRVEFVGLLDRKIKDAAAKRISAKYEQTHMGGDAVPRRPSILQGNILPTPFARSATESKRPDDNNNRCSKTLPADMMVTYEQIPADALIYELEEGSRNSVFGGQAYEEATQHGVTDGHQMPIYEEAATFIQPDQLSMTIPSDSDTDYEIYECNSDEKEDEKKRNGDASESRQGKGSKKSNDSRREKVKADPAGARFTGVLFQRGKFQFQRRFCIVYPDGRFLCCKSEKSLKVVLEIRLTNYEVVHQEKRDGKQPHAHEIRMSCPGKETHLFYTDTSHVAEDWVKELRKATSGRRNNPEDNPEYVSLTDTYGPYQRCEDNESNISGGSIEKTVTTAAKLTNQHSDENRKKSKLQNLLDTVGKKLGNKTRNLLQSIDINQQKIDEPDAGYVSILSEDYTGDRWFKRFCRIENGVLNCYRDHSPECRPEFQVLLQGAQLKPIEEKDVLKINIVQNGREHCLKMDDFMEHGKWLMSLIRETGYANQLLQAAKQVAKDAPANDPSRIYEELRMFCELDGATLDESCPDDEAPPLPTCSPPPTPPAVPEGSAQSNEGIYLEPSEWRLDVEELVRAKQKHKSKVTNVPPPSEESTYINRDFLFQHTNQSQGMRPVKGIHPEPSRISSSSSFPNLTKIGASLETANGGTDGSNKTEAGGAKKGDVVMRNQPNRYRPASAFSNSAEKLPDAKQTPKPPVNERSGIKNATQDHNSSDRHVDNQKKQFVDSSSSKDQKKTGENLHKTNSSRTSRDAIWDDIRKASRTRTSESSDDHARDRQKHLVQNLVKMFEGGAR